MVGGNSYGRSPPQNFKIHPWIKNESQAVHQLCDLMPDKCSNPVIKTPARLHSDQDKSIIYIVTSQKLICAICLYHTSRLTIM